MHSLSSQVYCRCHGRSALGSLSISCTLLGDGVQQLIDSQDERSFRSNAPPLGGYGIEVEELQRYQATESSWKLRLSSDHVVRQVEKGNQCKSLPCPEEKSSECHREGSDGE